MHIRKARNIPHRILSINKRVEVNSVHLNTFMCIVTFYIFMI